jgi:DNA-binding CsgD family transcriptional regulator
MDAHRIARLTEQQRACLRYVYAHLTSKEIAPLLNIAPGSVDQHIKSAMRLLDVPDRRTAARLLAQYECRDNQPLAYQSPGVAVAHRPGEDRPQTADQELRHPSSERPAGADGIWFPAGVLRPGDLNWKSRLMWIVVIAIGMAVAFGVLVSAIDALVRITGR